MSKKVQLEGNFGGSREDIYPATMAEIVYAKDGKNLEEKINETNTQLSHKAGYNTIWGMSNMGQDVKEAMTGGSVAVVGKDTILTENIVDNQVTPVKTNFMGVEEITPSWNEGYYIYNGTVPSVKSGANFKVSNPIEVRKGETIEVVANVNNSSVIQLAKVVSKNTDMTKSTSIVRAIAIGSTTELTATYSANDDVEYIAVTALISNGATIRKYYNLKRPSDSITIEANWIDGYYVDRNKNELVANANYKYCDIKLDSYESLYVSTYETNEIVGILSTTSNIKLDGVSEISTGYATLKYVPTKAETVRVCCRVATDANIYKLIEKSELRKGIEDARKNNAEMISNDFLKHLISNVICIGDSLTKGAYYSDELGYSGNAIKENYPYFLEKLTDWVITNKGHSGYTAQQWWNGYGATYDFSQHDTFILWLGTNDGFTDTLNVDVNGSDYNNYADTNTGCYCKIIEKIKQQRPDCKIFMVDCFATSGNLEITQKVLKEIATKYNLPLINVDELYPNPLYHTIYNGKLNVHFSKVGNLHVAHHFLSNIIELISKDKSSYERLLL